MKIKDLTPGLEVAFKYGGSIRRAVVLEPRGRGKGPAGVVVSFRWSDDREPVENVATPAMLLAPWPEYVRQESEKEERRRAEREVQIVKALEYTKRVEEIDAGLSSLGIESWVIDRDEDRVSISFEEAERLIERLRSGT